MTFDCELHTDGYSITNSPNYPIGKDRAITAYTGAARALPVSRPHNAPLRKTVFILDLGDPRVSLSRALPVSVEVLPSTATAWSPDTGDFGVGADEVEAIDEFRAGLVELYFLLKDEQDNLGPLPQRHWNFLSSVIIES